MTVPFQRSVTLWGAVVMFSFLAVSTSQAQSCRSGFAGEWETTYGRLTLSVSDDEVWGVYGTNNRISGRVYGRTLEGRWEYPNGRWGRLRFAHDGYGKFTGNWGEKDGNLNAKWTGSCVGGAAPAPPPSRPSAPSRPTAAPPAGPSRPPGFAPSCSAFFGGTWNTNFGKMILTVRGDEARGSYGPNNTVSGRIRGNQLEGTWRYTNGRWGRFAFTHDGRGGFSGRYGEKDGPMTSTWRGSCERTPPGAISPGGPGPGGFGGGPSGTGGGCATGFAGEWSTGYGRMVLGVSGDQVSGTYGTNRTLSGRIIGNVLEGVWRYPSGRWGRVRFVHSGNGSFSGNWGEKDGPLRNSWSGTCQGGPPAVSGGFSGMCAHVSGTGGHGVCSDPRTEQLMNEWLSRAIPPQAPGASLRYDCWGRAIGQARTGVITANQRPDTDGRTRCNYLLDHSHLYHSSNMGTMRDYLISQ